VKKGAKATRKWCSKKATKQNTNFCPCATKKNKKEPKEKEPKEKESKEKEPKENAINVDKTAPVKTGPKRTYKKREPKVTTTLTDNEIVPIVTETQAAPLPEKIPSPRKTLKIRAPKNKI